MSIYTPKQPPSFYNNLPHTMEDRTPYTYLIGWSKLNTWYYGVQYGKNVHPENLFNKSGYKTSSIFVADFIKEHGNPNIIQIRRIFNSIQKAQEHEINVLRRLNKRFKILSKHSNWLNDSIHRLYHDCTGTVTVKDSNGDYFRVHKDDPRFIARELVGVNANTNNIKNSKIMKGNVFAENIKTGERMRMSLTDERYVSGLFKSVGTGTNIKWTEEMKEAASKRASGENNPMFGKSAVKGRSWYNDGAKSFMLFNDDIRVLSMIKGRI